MLSTGFLEGEKMIDRASLNPKYLSLKANYDKIIHRREAVRNETVSGKWPGEDEKEDVDEYRWRCVI